MQKMKYITLLLVLISIGMYSQTTPGEYTVKNVITNTKYSDFGTSFYGKDKVIFASPKDNTVITKKTWSGNDQPFLDLYIGRINEKGEIIGKQRVLGDVNNKFHEGVVSFTKDLKTVYFSANNYTENNKAKKDSTGIVNIQLYKASVKDNGEWTNVVKLPFNNDGYSTGHPALNKDDTKLYFVSDRPSSVGKTDIYIVDIKEDNTYSQPKNLGPRINTEEREMFPFISDESILYFSSTGHPGYGGLDVFASRIFDTTVSEPINLEDPVNSENDDFAFIINDTKHKGYFSSNNRKDGKGDDDIYSFIAFPPLKIEGNQTISGIVINKVTQELIPGAIVVLLDEEGNELEKITVSDYIESSSKLNIEDINLNYHESVTVTNGEVTDISINTTVDNPNPNTGEEVEFTVEIINKGTSKAKGLKVSDILPSEFRYVSDDGDGTYLSDEDLVALKNLAKGETIKIKIKAIMLPTGKDGSFSFEVKSDTKYKIAVIAPGYLKEVTDIKTTNDTDIDPLELNISLAEELRVVDEKIMININTIYFDFDKWNIRPEAAKELDKVIAVMKEHPSMIIEGGSHTDSRAREAYNQILSEKRANATMAYIVAAGIDPSRITAKGYGEMQLVNNCSSFVKCSREKHQLNRRTEFVIVNDDDRFVSTAASLDDVVIGSDNMTKVRIEGVKSNEYQTVSPDSSEEGLFYIIAGAYSEVDNAIRKANELKKLGYDPIILKMKESGLSQVTYNSYSNKQKALTDLNKIKETIDNAAWLLVKKSQKTPVSSSQSNEMSTENNQLVKSNINYIKIPPIYFEFDKWGISESELEQLDEVVQIMKDNPTIIVEAGAHTDSKNLESYNQLLSEKRARSVVKYIISKGIKPNRIVGKGYGEMKLINHCKSFVKCTPEEQQANRRTEFKIINR